MGQADQPDVAQQRRLLRLREVVGSGCELEVVARRSPVLELHALGLPPPGDLGNCPRPRLQDPALDLVVELALGHGPSEVAPVLHGHLVQHFMDLLGGRGEQAPPLVLVVSEALVVDEVVQRLVLPPGPELLDDLPEALADLAVLDVEGVAEHDARVVHVVRGAFLLQQLEEVADHPGEVAAPHLRHVVVEVTEAARHVAGQQLAHFFPAQLSQLLRLLRQRTAELQLLEVLEQVAGEAHTEAFGLLEGLELQKQQHQYFREQVLPGVEGEFVEDGEDVFCEEVDAFEALELHGVVEVESALLLGVLAVGAVEPAAVEIPALDDFLGVAGLQVEPVQHRARQVAHPLVRTAAVELQLLVHVLLLLAIAGLLQSHHVLTPSAPEVVAAPQLLRLLAARRLLLPLLLRVTQRVDLVAEGLLDDVLLLHGQPVLVQEGGLVHAVLDTLLVEPMEDFLVFLADCPCDSGGLGEDEVVVLLEEVGEVGVAGLLVVNEFVGDGGGPVDEAEGVVDEGHGLAVVDAVALVHAQH